MASVMVSVEVVGLPPLSSMVTAGWVDQAAPFGPPPGWVVNTSLLGAPTVMANEVLVAGATDPEVESVAVRV